MKTLKTTLLALSFLLFASILVKAHAATKPGSTSKAKVTMNYVLNKYIETTTLGKLEEFTALLDDNFTHCTTYKGKTVSYGKKETIDYMKQFKNVKQNCTSTYAVVESNPNFSIAKVELKYPTFTKIDYVTMSNQGDTWKITNVFTTYP